MHGCGWDSGAARERSSALAASVASRYELGADGVGAARPGARGSRVTASRYALGAEGGGAARPGAYLCPPRNCARCLLGGGGDVEDVVCCPLLERLGARRASSSCGGRGWGGTPRGPCCHRLRHTRAEHRYGGSWQEGGARAASPPLQGLAPPARRPRAAGAPWEARARAARVQTAGEDLVVVVVAATPNYLRQASPDRGKYLPFHTIFLSDLSSLKSHARHTQNLRNPKTQQYVDGTVRSVYRL